MESTKYWTLSMLNGIGYAAAASTALAWAFPKLAKRSNPASRIVCGLAGFAWTVWQGYRYTNALVEEQTGDSIVENLKMEIEAD